MARKARQRISYVLPLAKSSEGHRLGVNGLAVDTDQPILYSGGRDGVICAWNLNFDLRKSGQESLKLLSPVDDAGSKDAGKKEAVSTFRSQVQAHTHWINDIVLTQSNAALVSASSDITVKVWRPHSEERGLPSTIGLHDDYVKCLASPTEHSDWVASGGLDHRIRLWDLNGGGEKLQIDVGEDDSNVKGSVYALSVRGSVMASGGPESTVKLWDPRSGKRITKFVGHTDNIRSILISQDGDTVLTASSDQTVKVWSVMAGRCIYTLTMHNASIWSLYSDHPRLSTFYSGDRSGLVAKTDIRGSDDLDRGLSLAIAQEHEGINKIVASRNHFWTATSSSSINRWEDVDLDSVYLIPDSPKQPRQSSVSSRSKVPPPAPQSSSSLSSSSHPVGIPLYSLLQPSNGAGYLSRGSRDGEVTTSYQAASIRKLSEAVLDQELEVATPVNELPQETIEGQNGLIKHVILNDRKRVLTLDTAGEVVMWDLLKCVPIQSFGKRHLEDVAPEVNTTESVANWCAVDTRTGRLACALEENYCFDAEIYADELASFNPSVFKEDQRINLGKWIIRYLFAGLVNEELNRDAMYREGLATQYHHRPRRDNAPPILQLPPPSAQVMEDDHVDDDFYTTPRAANGIPYTVTTPGLSIGVATPFPRTGNQPNSTNSQLPRSSEEAPTLEKKTSHAIQPRVSIDKAGDYFSTPPAPQSPADNAKGPTTPGDSSLETAAQPAADADKEEKSKEGGSLFGKKFRMNFPKKLGRTSVDAKPPVVDEKSETSEKSEDKEEKLIYDNFFGSVQKIRHEYNEQLQLNPNRPLHSGITPSLPNETPELRLPPNTAIIIQEDRPDTGGVADLYRGTVSSVGREVDLVEQAGPMWLGDLLLRNQIPVKEISKVSFFLLPFEDLLPSIASADGNSRLNANRMLRAKKILAYVAERIDPQPVIQEPDALKPEDYLELYCQNQVVPPDTTLATLRAHIWKTAGDVMLYYKSNGRKPELEHRASNDQNEQQRPTSTDSQPA